MKLRLIITHTLTPNQHSDDAENLLACSVCTDIAKAYTRQTGASKVECGDVGVRVRNVIHGHPKAISERVDPACVRENTGELIIKWQDDNKIALSCRPAKQEQ